MRARTLWAWFWITLGVLYFFVPLYATLQFSLKAERGVIGVLAYERVLNDPRFLETLANSLKYAISTIIVSIALIVPTAYWVHLRLPTPRPLIELITLMPFVIPAVVLVFGLIRTYGSLLNSPLITDALLVMGYTVLALPYMYRAVDTGLRAIDVRTLTEAAQSLGASGPTILWRVILPNLRVAMLSGAFLALAIVIGEFTLASLLSRPAFGPYLSLLIQNRPYDPAALTILSFSLTWAAIALIQWIGQGSRAGQSQLGGAR